MLTARCGRGSNQCLQRSYVGTDIIAGPGVDEIVDISGLTDRFGEAAFNVVICTEVVEHVRTWRSAISNLKRILRPGGLLLLTTRSRGFHRHAWPEDWWRYEVEDMREIFADLDELHVEPDPQLPGVFVIGRRPVSGEFRIIDTSRIKLYSMVAHRRCKDVGPIGVALDTIAHRGAEDVLPGPFKRMLKRQVLREGE